MDVKRFLEGERVLVFSSNVLAMTYRQSVYTLYIEYKRGSVRSYWYRNVTPDVAVEIYTAASKGKRVWDLLRVRGTRYGHRVPYGRGEPPGFWERLWGGK